jgi:hypothetical protein
MLRGDDGVHFLSANAIVNGLFSFLKQQKAPKGQTHGQPGGAKPPIRFKADSGVVEVVKDKACHFDGRPFCFSYQN